MRQSISTWKLGVVPAVAVLALLALTIPATAPASSDPCTQTLSNAGTATGSSVRDVICGTSGIDTLLGRGGNDELRGFGGDDDLNGGIGNDELFGAGGKDFLVGESGNDTLNGSSGNDVLEGGSADDVLTGGTGDDAYLAGSGDDKILARDGENDGPFGLSTCGDGTDSIDMDLADAVVTGALRCRAPGGESYLREDHHRRSQRGPERRHLAPLAAGQPHRVDERAAPVPALAVFALSRQAEASARQPPLAAPQGGAHPIQHPTGQLAQRLRAPLPKRPADAPPTPAGQGPGHVRGGRDSTEGRRRPRRSGSGRSAKPRVSTRRGPGVWTASTNPTIAPRAVSRPWKRCGSDRPQQTAVEGGR